MDGKRRWHGDGIGFETRDADADWDNDEWVIVMRQASGSETWREEALDTDVDARENEGVEREKDRNKNV